MKSDPSSPIRAIRVICGHSPLSNPLRLCAFATLRLTRWTLPLITGLAIALTTAPALAEEPSHGQAAQHHDLPTMLFVFMLASFIGLGVITRVSRLLHTPLMSLTNAISAIAIIGAITVTGVAHGGLGATPRFSIINFLGAIALFASTVNIVSGFLITDRMLKMFKRQEPTKS